MGLFRRRRDAYDDLDGAPDAPAEADDDGDLHDAFDDDHEDEEPGGAVAGVVSKALAGVVVSGLFAAAILYAYSWSVNQQGEGDQDLPVVQAEPGPDKVKPEDPGGMDVPYQDQLVLNQDAGEGREGEQLLPPPEDPNTAETGSAVPEDGSRGSGASGADAANGGGNGTPGTASASSSGQEAGGDGADPGDQVASTEPERTPEDTADPDAGTDTATPSEPADPAQSEQEGGTSADPASDGPDGEPDAMMDGDSGGNNGDAANGRDTATRTDQADDAASGDGGAFLVQLAAFENRENAEKAWQRIQDKHRNVLGNQKLQLQRKRIPDKGIFWRVRTGPFPNRATADDLCGQLKDRGQPCLVMER